jgi:putative dimethyl sulfoxide reductase chaperone
VTKKQRDTTIEVLAGFRLAFYLLLSRAFSRELNKAVLKNMEQISGTLMDVWETLGLPPDPDIDAGRAILKGFFSRLNGDDADKVCQSLAREYASLFLGVGPVTVPLCESVYRSASGLLYQSTLFQVEQSYREIGMAKSDLYQEPDDHIAVELSYMARLCETVQEGADGDRERVMRTLKLQQDFLDAHLSQWVPLFAQRVIMGAPADFYRAMAHLLKGYTGIDKGLIEVMTEGITD